MNENYRAYRCELTIRAVSVLVLRRTTNERKESNEWGEGRGKERRRNLRVVMLPEQQGPVCEPNHSNASGLTHTAAESRQTDLGHGVREWMGD